MEDDHERIDRVVSSDPINRVAAQVTSKGVHWNPKRKPTNAIHRETPLEIGSLKMAKKSLDRSLTITAKAPSSRDVLSVRLTTEERGILQREAMARGDSLAGFVRTLVMDHVRRPKRSPVLLETNTRTTTVGTVSGKVAEMTKSPRTVAAS